MGHHDVFFKQTFSIKEHAVDYLRHVLPDEINDGVDYSSLCLENSSYVDDQLSEHFSDMVYSCFYGKIIIKVALLFEHKSYPDHNLPRQLNKYMVKIWDADAKQNKELSPVIPLVLYHGKESCNPQKLETQLGHFFEIGRIYFEKENGLQFLESIIK